MTKYRERLCGGLWKRRILTKYITFIKDMYDDVVTSVRVCDGVISEFFINIRLHQRSALSPYIFALVMDEVTKSIQGEIPWCMLFAEDVVLIDDSRIGVDRQLELWRQTLESKGFRLSRTKTEYIKCKFSDVTSEDGDVARAGQVASKKESFRYIESMFKYDGKINEDVSFRIPAGWVK